MALLERISSRLDRLNLGLGRAASWLALPIIAIILWDVVSRRFMASGSVALQEAEWHLHALLFLLCAGYAYLHDDHVRVDVFRSRFSARTRAWIELAGCLAFLIPFCIVVILLGLWFAADSFALREISDAPGGLPFRYAIKAAVPLAFFFLLLQGISTALKQIVILTAGGGAGEEAD